MKPRLEKNIDRLVEEPPEKNPDLNVVDEKQEILNVKDPGFVLVVKSPFKNYSKGDQIISADEIQRIMNCKERHMVVKRATKREIN